MPGIDVQEMRPAQHGHHSPHKTRAWMQPPEHQPPVCQHPEETDVQRNCPVHRLPGLPASFLRTIFFAGPRRFSYITASPIAPNEVLQLEPNHALARRFLKNGVA